MLCSSIASRLGGSRRDRVHSMEIALGGLAGQPLTWSQQVAASHRVLLPHPRALASDMGTVGARQQHHTTGAGLSRDSRETQNTWRQAAASRCIPTSARLAARQEKRVLVVGGG